MTRRPGAVAIALALLAAIAPAREISAEPELLAFPTAEGFGARAVGGRGGTVIEVTNLSDSGPGSLRAALEATGPRTIVFRTGGTIELASSITIRSPYVTIAGQTAPGDGIAVANDPDNTSTTRAPLIVATHDVIVRHLRVRPGVSENAPPRWANAVAVDGIRIAGTSKSLVRDVILDHTSVGWALDENVQVGENARDVTVQWSIISEGLDKSVHPDGAHSRGLLATGRTTERISIHHNLFAHNEDRNPQLSLQKDAEVVNNVVYDYRFKAMSSSDAGARTGAPVGLSLRGNYVKRGPDSTRNHHEMDLFPTIPQSPGWRLHLDGNIGPFRTANNQPNEDALNQDDLGAFLIQSPPFVVPDTSDDEPAGTAFDDVLEQAGATLPRRDPVDERVVHEVRNGSGGLIDSQSEVGGWPELAPGTPPPDDDHDGMPNPWETSHGLDPNDPADGAQTSPSGYTWLEDYLNELAGDGGTTIDPIQVDGLIAGGSASDARSYSTASFAPTQGELIVVFVANSIGSGTARVPALTGNNLTWQQIRTNVEPSSLRRVTAFRAFASDPSTGPLTISFASQKQARVTWSVMSASSTAATAPANGADGIVQTAAANGSGSAGTVTLTNTAAASGDRPLVGFWHAAAEGSMPRASWSEIHDVVAGSEALGLETQWRSDAFEQPASASWSSKVRWGTIALELRQQS